MTVGWEPASTGTARRLIVRLRAQGYAASYHTKMQSALI